jgi:hypothetical protein
MASSRAAVMAGALVVGLGAACGGDAVIDGSSGSSASGGAGGAAAQGGAAGEGGGGRSCGGFAGERCTEREYCDFEPSTCDGIGACKPRPTGCDKILAPVCGCDGAVHDNECFAYAAGTDSSEFEGGVEARSAETRREQRTTRRAPSEARVRADRVARGIQRRLHAAARDVWLRAPLLCYRLGVLRDRALRRRRRPQRLSLRAAASVRWAAELRLPCHVALWRHLRRRRDERPDAELPGRLSPRPR